MIDNKQFEEIIFSIKRDTNVELLTDADNDMHLGEYIIEPDVSFKPLKAPDYTEFSLVFGNDSQIVGPKGYENLTIVQSLLLKLVLENTCYNEERHERRN